MTHTPTIFKFVLLGLLLVIQFFWLLATFAHSDTDRSQERASRERAGESARIDAAMTVPALPAAPTEPAAPSSPTVRFPDVGGTRDPASPNSPSSPSSPSTPSSPGPDLGAQIKYCIVFPLLNAAGEPIPTFDVPECPLGPPPPPPPGSPRLTVVKVVINDDSGTATTTDFTLLVGSTTVTSGVQRTYLAGAYIVSEATTTATIGTTTQQYVPEFSGDCDSAGSVTLVAGDTKTCTIINDDPGPGGQGGEGNGGGNGGGGGGGGGPGPTSAGGGGGGGGGGGAGGPGQIAGAVTPEPEFMGGAEGVPGAPNAGSGGRFADVLGMLLFSGAAALLGGFLSRILHKRRFVTTCQA